MIYTSYFAKLKKFPENFQPIAICQFPPKWYTGPSIKIFSPNQDILLRYKGGQLNEEEYTKLYQQQLSNINISYYIEKIFSICKKKTPIFLCYEKSKDFCHRHILADYLNNLGYPCEEWAETEDQNL